MRLLESAGAIELLGEPRDDALEQLVAVAQQRLGAKRISLRGPQRAQRRLAEPRSRARLLSFGAWLCLLVIIALWLKKRLPGLARYFVVGALLAMAVMMALPFLELALGVNIFN